MRQGYGKSNYYKRPDIHMKTVKCMPYTLGVNFRGSPPPPTPLSKIIYTCSYYYNYLIIHLCAKKVRVLLSCVHEHNYYMLPDLWLPGSWAAMYNRHVCYCYMFTHMIATSESATNRCGVTTLRHNRLCSHVARVTGLTTERCR